MAEEITAVVGTQFTPLKDLLMNDLTLQLVLFALVVGLLGIFYINKKISLKINSKKIYYIHPFKTEFIKKIMFSLFAICLIISVSYYVQVFELFTSQEIIDAANESDILTPRETLAKILDTMVILIVGYTVAQLIPIIISINENKIMEKIDYQEWIHIRGFSDDEDELFHKLFEWSPPKHGPSELSEEEYQEKLRTVEGRKYLENFYTSKGAPIGSFKQKKPHTFEKWKKSEYEKYEKYFDDCISGDNESGQVLRPGVFPEEIYTFLLWKDQKRISHYDPIIPGAKPPGWAERQGQNTPKAFKQLTPLLAFAGIIIGIAAWWGVDLMLIATASGGLAIGIGFALQETMQNYFAYLTIKKEKIFVEGDRVKLENGFVGIVQLITPRVTYVREGLNESVAIIPTRQLISAIIVNYSKDTAFVPARIDVGVSYLCEPEEVVAVLMKVGTRAMKEIVDVRGNHLVAQEKCPYRIIHKPSCGCDKNILVDIEQPKVRLTAFNSSSIDFSLWVYSRDYASQFKIRSSLRIMTIKEFQKHNIPIPWPIETKYDGDVNKELKEMRNTDSLRKETLEEYGLGDLNNSN